MKQSPPNTEAAILSKRKRRFGFEFVVQETNAAEAGAMLGAQLHAEATQCSQAIRHEAFATGFVDRRFNPVRNKDFKAALANCNRSGQPGWTATDYEDVSL
jgi:hypothetical protein